MPAGASIFDLFNGSTLSRGKDLYTRVLFAPHCLGTSRLHQLLSSKEAIHLEPPFMSICNMKSFVSEHTKSMISDFKAGCFLEEATNGTASNLVPASPEDLVEWMKHKSEHGGFYMNIAGHVVRTCECPFYDECMRDERHLEATLITLELNTLAMCRIMAENTMLFFKRQLESLLPSRSRWICIRHTAIWKDGWKKGSLHILLTDSFMVMFQCKYFSVEMMTDDMQKIRGGLYNVTMKASVGFLQATYFNVLHAASVARGIHSDDATPPDVEDAWEFSEDLSPQHYIPISADGAVDMIRNHVLKRGVVDPDGVD